MEKLHFSVNINASKEKVWQTLWDDTTYRKWTSAFSETSYAVSCIIPKCLPYFFFRGVDVDGEM